MKPECTPNILTLIIVFLLKVVLATRACFLKWRVPQKAGAYITETPVVGDTITNDHALDLCRKYGFNALIDRLTNYPDHYKEWQFDGVSMAPDCLISILVGSPNITKFALKHDLKYAYGDPGNIVEKRDADQELWREIVADGGRKWAAGLLLCAVEVFGREEYGFDFSWCFAHKKKKSTKYL